jgi:hypothetical protein
VEGELGYGDYHTFCWNYADYHQAIAEVVWKNW